MSIKKLQIWVEYGQDKTKECSKNLQTRQTDNYSTMLTVCVVSKSMDMETMVTRSETFDFSCQLHRGWVTLADGDYTIYQKDRKGHKRSCQSQMARRISSLPRRYSKQKNYFLIQIPYPTQTLLLATQHIAQLTVYWWQIQIIQIQIQISKNDLGNIIHFPLVAMQH